MKTYLQCFQINFQAFGIENLAAITFEHFQTQFVLLPYFVSYLKFMYNTILRPETPRPDFIEKNSWEGFTQVQ